MQELQELIKVALGTNSPYFSESFGPLLAQVKLHARLPVGGFNAPVYWLYQTPSFLVLVLPCLMQLV